VFGVFPLVIASGAGEAGRQALGLAVFGGLLSALIVGALIAPPIFVLVQMMRERGKKAA
jgi:HAE1 family hydrophobic/amphiphilic exporter-1